MKKAGIVKTLKSEVVKMVRELRCPYGDDFEGGDECDRCEQYELCMETYPPVNLIEIPRGATNGDMIKAMFPKCCSNMGNFDNGIVVDFMGDLHSFDTDFWNAPYKRGDLDGSN